MKRTITILFILTLVVGASVAGYYTTMPAESDNQTGGSAPEFVTVGRETMVDTVEATGRIEPQAEVEMRFEIGGMVQEVLVKRGQHVTAGTVLARLETDDLELEIERARIDLAQQEAELEQLFEPKLAEKITSAQVNVESARLSLAELEKGPDQDEITKAEAELSRKKIALKKAQWDYDQVSYRGDVGAMAQADALQEATLDYEAALATYNQAVEGPTEAELAKARYSLAEARATLAELLQAPSAAEIAARQATVDKARLTLQEKERDLEQGVLIAPTDGVITEVNIEPGERALNEETGAAIVLTDTSAYLLNVEVDEIDISRIRRSLPVVITLDAIGDKEFRGQVADVAPRPVKQDDPNAIVTYEVTISLADDDARLLTGMSAIAAIEVERFEATLIVPNRAIRIERGSDKSTVYVEKLDEQDNVMRVEVELGLRDDSVTQVVAGLEEGDRIILPAPPAPAPSL